MRQKRKIFTDWIVGVYSLNNDWEIFWQDQIFSGHRTETYKNQLYNIIRSYDKKTTPIIFMNYLQKTKDIFNDFTECGEKNSTHVGRHTTWGRAVVDKHTAEIRNLDDFCPDAISQRLTESTHPIVDAVNFLMTLSSVPSEIMYSLGHMVKKSVADGIEYIIKEQYNTKKSSIMSVKTFYDMLCGCKSGIIWAENFNTLNHNITQYDKSSAYSSVMVNDNKFPIGKITQSYGDYALLNLKTAIKHDKWVKVVFDKDAVLPKHLDFFKDLDDDRVAMEYWDIKDCTYDLVEICKKNKGKFIVYRTSETGYLCKEYRDKIVEIYTQKQQLSKGDFYRDYAKAKLELIYGKGLQERTFNSDREVMSYLYRPENYINPAMSMHCCAAVRYELRRALMENNITYCDTDSIHGIDSKKFNDNVKKYNQEIIEKNAKAGYKGLKIGVFELEYANSDEIVLKKKQRVIFTKDGEFITAIAGIPKKYIYNEIENMTKDEIIEHIMSGGIDRTVIRKYMFVPSMGFGFRTEPFSKNSFGGK